MSVNNKAYPSGHSGHSGLMHARRRVQSILCAAVLAATLPFASGCSPEIFAGGALVISLLSAHLKNSSSSARPPEPAISRPIQANPSQARASYANDMSGQSSPTAEQHTFLQSERLTAQISPVVVALQAYRQMRWTEAARALNDAIEGNELSRSELCRAYTLLGAMEYQMGHTQTAWTYFAKAYQRDPEAMPSSELFPPQVIEFYNAVRKKGGK